MGDFIHGKDGQTDYATLHSVESALRGLTEEEKRLIAVSTISVVTRLAVEFETEEVRFGLAASLIQFYSLLQVTRLTVSMLLQHLRSAEPTVEAVIAFNLVDLALCAPENAFVDIIRAFSAINRTANPDDPRLSNNMVRHHFEVPYPINNSLRGRRSSPHRQGWRSSSTSAPNCMKCTLPSY